MHRAEHRAHSMLGNMEKCTQHTAYKARHIQGTQPSTAGLAMWKVDKTQSFKHSQYGKPAERVLEQSTEKEISGQEDVINIMKNVQYKRLVQDTLTTNMTKLNRKTHIRQHMRPREKTG